MVDVIVITVLVSLCLLFFVVIPYTIVYFLLVNIKNQRIRDRRRKFLLIKSDKNDKAS
jgi:hypothetical protein